MIASRQVLAGCLAVLGVCVLCSSAPAAFTVTFKNGNVTNNTSEDGANYKVTVYGNQDAGYSSLRGDEVVFLFSVGAGESGKISEIYFQNGTLLALSAVNINNVGIVNFQGGSANPGNLPGGNNAPIVAFQAHDGFVADVVKNTKDAVAAGEATGILFQLQSPKGYADVVVALQQGANNATTNSSGVVNMRGGLRIGIHVRDANGGQSDSFINEQPTMTAVPVPAGVVLLSLGIPVLFLGRLRRRQKPVVE